MADYSPYQQKIIKRYYKNYDSIQSQKLAEMVTELYLAEGKKLDRLWTRVADTLTRLEFPASRIEHLLQKRDPALLAGVMKELEAGRRAERVDDPSLVRVAQAAGRGSIPLSVSTKQDFSGRVARFRKIT